MSLKEIYNTRQTITDKQHVLNFGKYKNRTIEFVMEIDPQWLLFCQSKIDWFDLHHSILDEIEANAEYNDSMPEYSSEFWKD